MEDSNKEEVETINGFEIEVLQDEDLYNAAIFYYLIKGGVVGLIIFLVGWLALDYLWPSLFFGFVFWVIYTLRGSWILDSAKEEYDELVKEFQEDAEELGISTEQAQNMMNTFVNVVDKASKNSNK